MGLGKTISAGLIISELDFRGRLSKILIVAPKLLGPQWQEELKSKFDIPAEVAIGKDLVEADPDGTGAIITTYNSAVLCSNGHQNSNDTCPGGRYPSVWPNWVDRAKDRLAVIKWKTNS